MKVIAFDLSSVCIGCCIAELKDDKTVRIFSTPIIPKHDTNIISSLGFLKSKHRIKDKNYISYVKYSGELVSEKEKKKRDVMVREAMNKSVLNDISKQLSEVITTIKPDLIIMEKHAIFNGILTSVLLAKIAGILIGVAGDNNIETREYPVKEVRSILDINKITGEYISNKTPDDLLKVPDITKDAIREYFEKIYGVSFQTCDESDACAVFHYWYKTKNGA